MDINEIEQLGKQVKTGIVAIVGPPNAGKSTLLNTLLGQKISIVTPKPQTTRNRVLGVVNGEDHQVVLIDTPGLHKTSQRLNKEMVRVALESLNDVDAVLYLLDISHGVPGKKQETKKKDIANYLEKVKSPVILILNKIDLIDKEQLLPLITYYSELYPFKVVVPISAIKKDGTDLLLNEILKLLPMGPRYFPEDMPTDLSERFLVSEIVREKLFLSTGQEIPYSSAVIIDSFQEDNEKKQVTIHASIVLEKSSQKGIVIGKGGKKLKSIGVAARKDIERLIGEKVNLKLWVKVKKNWSQDERFLKDLGF